MAQGLRLKAQGEKDKKKMALVFTLHPAPRVSASVVTSVYPEPFGFEPFGHELRVE
jgi:hypothetical protein